MSIYVNKYFYIVVLVLLHKDLSTSSTIYLSVRFTCLCTGIKTSSWTSWYSSLLYLFFWTFVNVKNWICLCVYVGNSLVKCTLDLTCGSHLWPAEGILELCRETGSSSAWDWEQRLSLLLFWLMNYYRYDHWQEIIHCLPVSSREYKSRVSSP